MIMSNTGVVQLDGDASDLLADLGLATNVLAEQLAKSGVPAQTVIEAITGVCCKALADFLDKETEKGNIDDDSFDRLFEEAMKDWKESEE